MLDAHDDAVFGDDRPARLGTLGHGEELLGLTTIRTLERDGEAIILAVSRRSSA